MGYNIFLAGLIQFLKSVADYRKEKLGIEDNEGGNTSDDGGGVFGVLAHTGNIFTNALNAILGALGSIPATIIMSIKIGIAALGIALIVFIRNLSQSFGRPGTPARSFGNAAFGFLGLQLLGYVVAAIIGNISAGGFITMLSYIYLALGLRLSMKQSGFSLPHLKRP